MDCGTDKNFNTLLKFINDNNMCVIFINSSLDIMMHSDNTLAFEITDKKNLKDIFTVDIYNKLKLIVKEKKDIKTSLIINKEDISVGISHLDTYISLSLERRLKPSNVVNNDISDKIRSISSSSILAINSLKDDKYSEILKINNYRILRYINHLDFMNTDLFDAEYTAINLNEFINRVNIAVAEYFNDFKVFINKNDTNIYLDSEKLYIVIYSIISDILININGISLDIMVKSNADYLYIYFNNVNNIISDDTRAILYKFAKLHDGMLLNEDDNNILCIKRVDLGTGLLASPSIKSSGVNICSIELSEALIKYK